MKAILTTIGIIILGIISFLIYRYLKVKQQGEQHNRRKIDRIEPLVIKLQVGEEIDKSEIEAYVKDNRTREMTYQALKEYNKLGLFSKEYLTIEKGAESNLVNWLEFPTELDAVPDEIEHLKEVIIDHEGEDIYYHVFKFKTYEPHWGAKDGWCLGVVGPYLKDSKPYDFPHATFSRIGVKLEDKTPEEEAKWVHQNIGLR